MRKIWFAASLILPLLFAFGMAAEIERPPAVAGQFYPADSAELAQMVSGHLNAVEQLPTINGRLVALIVPHAGLVYSGQIAAYGYKLLKNRGINRVIMCGPSHRLRFDGISVYGPDVVWRTPLGRVHCNNELCRQLLQADQRMIVLKEGHSREHCLEVQLPYLQTVLGDFQIAPLSIGVQDEATIEMLAKALAEAAVSENTLLIASTDWQHYRPASQGRVMDSLGMVCLKQFDPDRLDNLLRSGKVEMCGGAGVVAVMKAARKLGADSVKILRYGDSGDISGDKSSVVSYVAAAIYESTSSAPDSSEDRGASSTRVPMSDESYLTEADRATLLKLARTTLENYLRGTALPDFKAEGVLAKPGAAFVTLEKHGQLRGCIGYTSAIYPLYQTVSQCAIKAAVEDNRFPPVKSAELADLHIEISVLTPLQPVTSLDEIEVGRDGLMITLGHNRGLLLPQVATDYGWDREEFLKNTCRKAGLPNDAYLSSHARIERFQAIVFGEE